MSGYANEQMFRAMSIDREVDDPEVPGMIEANCGSFKDQIRVMAIAMGIEIDEIAFHAEFATADEDLDFGYMAVGKGRIAGFKGFVSGMKDGRPRVQCRFVWKLGDERMTPNWPVEHGYRVEIEGDQACTFLIEPTGEHFDGTVTTAMPCVNAIPRGRGTARHREPSIPAAGDRHRRLTLLPAPGASGAGQLGRRPAAAQGTCAADPRVWLATTEGAGGAAAVAAAGSTTAAALAGLVGRGLGLLLGDDVAGEHAHEQTLRCAASGLRPEKITCTCFAAAVSFSRRGHGSKSPSR